MRTNIAIDDQLMAEALRAKSVTVGKTIDCLIATNCIVHSYQLLHSDRDFEPFAEHLGLRVFQ